MEGRTPTMKDDFLTTCHGCMWKIVRNLKVPSRAFHLICCVGVFIGVIYAYLSFSSDKLTLADFQAYIEDNRVNTCHFQVHNSSSRQLSRRHFRWNDTRLKILDMKKIQFDKNFKNPCWYEPLESENPYRDNAYAFISPSANKSLTEMVRIWRERISRQKYPCRLRCLPYFLIIGQPKCGSTNLYWKIAQHPSVTPPPIKELHWWSRTRQGRRLNFEQMTTLEDYVDMFDKAAYTIESYQKLAGDFISPYVTGEASVSLFWDNNEWFYYPENKNTTSPRFVNPNYIRHFLPDVKLIVILRDPVERMYSDYLYFHKTDKSPEKFHEAVVQATRLYHACFAQTSPRQCVYNITLASKVEVRLRVGLYSVYLQDWLSVFPLKQLFILRLEDYIADTFSSLKKLYRFLELDDLTTKEWATVLGDKNENKRKTEDRELGDMFKKTRSLLTQFYEPFNEELALILKDNRFLWDDNTLW